MIDLLLPILLSVGIGSLTLFLVYLNWKILKISESIFQVNVDLLKETVIIKQETKQVKEISVQVHKETVEVRKALGTPIPATSENYLDF